MTPSIESIFPTPIVRMNIGRPISESEYSTIEYYKNTAYKNSGNTTSLERYILNNHFEDIRKFIQTSIVYYIDNIISPSNNIQFFITQSWLNYTKPGEHHHIHNHPNSIISGVFYFNAEENIDKITFHKHNYERILIENKKFNLYNSKSWWIPVKTGDLILFPSETIHEVESTSSDSIRTSLAFNVFAKGHFGDEEGLTSLYL